MRINIYSIYSFCIIKVLGRWSVSNRHYGDWRCTFASCQFCWLISGLSILLSKFIVTRRRRICIIRVTADASSKLVLGPFPVVAKKYFVDFTRVAFEGIISLAAWNICLFVCRALKKRRLYRSLLFQINYYIYNIIVFCYAADLFLSPWLHNFSAYVVLYIFLSKTGI